MHRTADLHLPEEYKRLLLERLPLEQLLSRNDFCRELLELYKQFLETVSEELTTQDPRVVYKPTEWFAAQVVPPLLKEAKLRLSTTELHQLYHKVEAALYAAVLPKRTVRQLLDLLNSTHHYVQFIHSAMNLQFAALRAARQLLPKFYYQEHVAKAHIAVPFYWAKKKARISDPTPIIIVCGHFRKEAAAELAELLDYRRWKELPRSEQFKTLERIYKIIEELKNFSKRLFSTYYQNVLEYSGGKYFSLYSILLQHYRLSWPELSKRLASGIGMYRFSRQYMDIARLEPRTPAELVCSFAAVYLQRALQHKHGKITVLLDGARRLGNVLGIFGSSWASCFRRLQDLLDALGVYYVKLVYLENRHPQTYMLKISVSDKKMGEEQLKRLLAYYEAAKKGKLALTIKQQLITQFRQAANMIKKYMYSYQLARILALRQIPDFLNLLQTEPMLLERAKQLFNESTLEKARKVGAKKLPAWFYQKLFDIYSFVEKFEAVKLGEKELVECMLLPLFLKIKLLAERARGCKTKEVRIAARQLLYILKSAIVKLAYFYEDKRLIEMKAEINSLLEHL
ncbi:MAG: hypothetical protein GXO42_00560 [bacterium]|nr:hypothetical protein [bacterium]